MLRQRTIVAILMVPAAVLVVRLGSGVYLLVILGALGLAAWEYTRMTAASGADASFTNVLVGVVALALGAAFPERGWLGAALAAFLILTTAWQAVRYERGAEQPLTDWSATLAGGCYLGYLGGFLVAIRELPDGFWWTMTVLPAIWLHDTGAYVIGTLAGRHKMTPRLSPKKSWEGFAGGVLVGTVGAALLAALWSVAAGPASAVNWQHGAAIGILVSIFGPIGDLGISMFKRQVAFKDTGRLLAGHGGVLDRIDSWLAAGAAGYFYLAWFVMPV